MKIALSQFECLLGKKQENMSKAREVLVNASSQGARILCFPEMVSSGYDLKTIGGYLEELAEEVHGEWIELFCDLAARYSISVVLPLILYDATMRSFSNTAILIDSCGAEVGCYTKVHNFELEKEYFTPGNSLQVFELSGVRIGVLICYDAGFPEAARSLALQGAQIIFIPSAWRKADQLLWDLNTASRAVENNVFVVAVNRTGFENDLHLFGRSRVVDPYGRLVVEAEEDREELLVADIDLEQISKAGNYFRYLENRRQDVYRL